MPGGIALDERWEQADVELPFAVHAAGFWDRIAKPVELERTLRMLVRVDPYIKANSPLRGKLKPGVKHGPGVPRILQRQKDEVASTRRALKKAARREGKREIEEGL